MTIEQFAAFEQLLHELMQLVQDHDVEFATEALLMAAYEHGRGCEVIMTVLQEWEAQGGDPLGPPMNTLTKFGMMEKFTNENGEECLRAKNERAKAYMEASIDPRAVRKVGAWLKKQGKRQQ
jgi:hypothetical protein